MLKKVSKPTTVEKKNPVEDRKEKLVKEKKRKGQNSGPHPFNIHAWLKAQHERLEYIHTTIDLSTYKNNKNDMWKEIHVTCHIIRYNHIMNINIEPSHENIHPWT